MRLALVELDTPTVVEAVRRACEDSGARASAQPRAGAGVTPTSRSRSTLEEWTDGRWVSTLHRVATPPPNTAGTRRQSLVFFHNPREDAYIDALATTAGEYILARAAQAFA